MSGFPRLNVPQAYVLGGHLECYGQVPETSFTMVAKAGGKDKQLSFERSAEPASGNVPEKASLFEAQVQWLKVTKAFAGSLPTITLNGTPYISFSFA